MRYASADDFGMPEAAFLICRFWLIDAWWSLGRREEARELFVDALRHRNRYGLLSEDIHPANRRAVGQFPADLFHGWSDPHGHAAVAQLGGSLLARLILVSNRVAIPTDREAARAGGLEVALHAALNAAQGRLVRLERGRRRARRGQDAARLSTTATLFGRTDLTEEDYQEYYNGFANRVLWPILHYRLDLAEFNRAAT